MTSGNNEINAALLDIWCEIALPYEDELEDCFNSIKEQCYMLNVSDNSWDKAKKEILFKIHCTNRT